MLCMQPKGPCCASSVLHATRRFFLLFVSFITSGRQAVLEAAHAVNLETLQPEPAEAAEQQLTQAAVLAPMLGLSEQQQEYIAVGMRLYYDLSASIIQEQKDVQTQLAACEEGMACSQPDRADSSSAACSNGASLTSLVQLEKQEGLTNRLNSLLHKVRCWCLWHPSAAPLCRWRSGAPRIVSSSTPGVNTPADSLHPPVHHTCKAPGVKTLQPP